MRNTFFVLCCYLLSSTLLFGQDMSDFNGGWHGDIANPKAFSFDVAIDGLKTKNPTITISNGQNDLMLGLTKTENGGLSADFGANAIFEGSLGDNQKEINGFIKSGILLYHIKLKGNPSKGFQGHWNILMLEELKSSKLFLSVENGEGDDYQAYPIFGDNRFTGTWCANFQKAGDHIEFQDFKTGLRFKGHLKSNNIRLEIAFSEMQLAVVELVKEDKEWNIGGFNSVENVKSSSAFNLDGMERDIASGDLPNTHAVIVSKKNRVLYEAYFDGYTPNLPHDMRSASKSVSSAIIGLALEKSLLKDLKAPLFDFLPTRYQLGEDSLKAKIDIKSLLTMSSGLDAIDFGIDRASKASEDAYQRSPDWTKTVLEAPMLYEPNTHANYGSANPYLLGIVMDSVVNGTTEMFMDEELFQKLGITNYIIQTDMQGRPYFGGGMYMTPGDMLKFGQLYLNQGKWFGKQILSKNWIERSLNNYRVLENTKDKNGYGFLWWHHNYTVNNKTMVTHEARGAGGQYIFLIPDLDVTVVITSGNFNNGKTQQPEQILKDYILPALMP